MPHKTLKRKLVEMCQSDIKIGLVMSRSESEFDKELDFFIENMEDLLKTRYVCKRYKQPKSDEWYTRILPELDDIRFQSQLRLSRAQFQTLFSLISNNVAFKSSNRPRQLPVDKQLAIALYRFGHNGSGSSFRNVGSKFGVGDGGTIINATHRVMKAILSLQNQHIYWPDEMERQELELLLEDDIPGCVGFIDGTHINLEEKPSVPVPDDYFSRKQRYGLHLQVVCDINFKIRHIKVGRTASAHDAKVFSESNLAKDPNKFFSDGQFLIGDAAYKLTKYIMTPFRCNSTVGTANQRKFFNRHLASKRVKIENTIGILKEKFQSLKELRLRISDDETHTFACQWIEVCCILYNMNLTDVDQSCFDAFKIMDDSAVDNTIHWDCNAEGEQKRITLLDFVVNLHN